MQDPGSGPGSDCLLAAAQRWLSSPQKGGLLPARRVGAAFSCVLLPTFSVLSASGPPVLHCFLPALSLPGPVAVNSSPD